MKKTSTVATASNKNLQRKLTIGLDLGDRSSWYCVLNEAGEVASEQRLGTTPKAMNEVFAAHSDGMVELDRLLLRHQSGRGSHQCRVAIAEFEGPWHTFFHLDEGYQYARGDYTTPDAFNFPEGVKTVENEVRAMGLVPGIWTAPFEISERSAVYRDHKDWLVHNAARSPIHAGYVLEEGKQDPLYILDVTHPAAQEYLPQTYQYRRAIKQRPAGPFGEFCGSASSPGGGESPLLA